MFRSSSSNVEKYCCLSITVLLIYLANVILGIYVLAKNSHIKAIDECNGSKIFYVTFLIIFIGSVMFLFQIICIFFSKTCFLTHIEEYETKKPLCSYYANIIIYLGYVAYLIYGIEYVCDNDFKNNNVFVYLIYNVCINSILFIFIIKYTVEKTTEKFCPNLYTKCCTTV